MLTLLLFLLGRACLSGIAFLLLRAFYRITFHPLARFPGPRLAAVTNLYAASYDIPGNSLVKHLAKLHKQYGPIVRVRPNELHVFDWDAYRTVFSRGLDFDRPAQFYGSPKANRSFLHVPDGRQAKPHRDLFVPQFSKSTISNLEPLVHEKQGIFLDRLREVAQQDTTVDLDFALSCLTGDIAMHYCYQTSLGLLEAPDFHPKLIVANHEFASIIPVLWYFPRLGAVLDKISNMLPEATIKQYFPAVVSFQDLTNICKNLITSLSRSPPDSKEVQSSVFRHALSPNKEKGQYTPTTGELTADAILFFLAGTDTTSFTLTCGLWAMIKNPQIYTRLRDELRPIVPLADSFTTLKHLEPLPYLRAVIKESLRVSFGVSARMPRVVPRGGVTLCNKHIPSGTWVSFAQYLYNHDPAIFPDPHTFNPDRWLESAEKTAHLEAHMISFSRGSRNCIGMNLAYSELNCTFAHLVRRFDLVNDGTEEEDMDWVDTYAPRLKGHLKVKLRAVEE